MQGKRLIVAAMAAVTFAGGAFAFAASLTVNTTQLGSGGSGVSSCDSHSVATSYTIAYDSTLKGFKVTNVTVNGIKAACATETMTVEVTGGASVPSSASLGEGSHVVVAGAPQTSHTVTATPNNSSSITAAAGTFSVADVGASISGTGVPANTTVSSVSADGVTATLSATATGTTSQSYTIADGTFTFTVGTTSTDGTINASTSPLPAAQVQDVHVAFNGGTPTNSAP